MSGARIRVSGSVSQTRQQRGLASSLVMVDDAPQDVGRVGGVGLDLAPGRARLADGGHYLAAGILNGFGSEAQLLALGSSLRRRATQSISMKAV